MKILYLHQYFVSPNGAGGTRSYEQARRLVQRGHQVTLVTSSAFMPEYADCKERVETWLDGFKLVVLPVAYQQSMSYARRTQSFMTFAAAAAAESRRHAADVVYATSTPLTIALSGIAARMLTGAPMVFEVRDLWPELPIALGALKSPIAKAAARSLEWLAYHSSASVVALSPGMARGVKERGIPPERVTIIPNGCDVDLQDVKSADVAALRHRMFPNLRPGQPLVVYGGAMGMSHDPGWLVDVAVQMQRVDPNVRFALVGRGAEAEAVQARARAAGVLDQNLWFRGPIPKHEVPLLLQGAQMATSTAAAVRELEDNSANKFFDALAAGIPVALNYGGWQAELLERYEAGVLLRRAKPAEAAHRLSVALRDGPRMERLRDGAKALAREQFDREMLTSTLERVLLQAAA